MSKRVAMNTPTGRIVLERSEDPPGWVRIDDHTDRDAWRGMAERKMLPKDDRHL